MKLTKYLCHAQDMLDNEIHMLAYFHKDSVTSCNEKEEIKKDYNWKKLWLLKKIDKWINCEKKRLQKKNCASSKMNSVVM